MLGSVFAKTIREQRRALGWWALGLVAAAVFTTSVYPAIKDNAAALTDVIDQLPEGLRRALLGASGDFFSPTGYLQARLFSTFAPLLLLIYAIGAGSRAIAGEEEARTLDVLLSLPIARRRVLLHKAAAMLLATAALGSVLWVTVAATGPAFEVRVGAAALAAAVVNTVLLAMVFGGVALAVGAGSGRRSLATGIATALAAGTYLVDVLALSVDGLSWLQRLSPFFYYRDPNVLAAGLEAPDAGVLAVAALVALGAALAAFERRDLTA